MITKKRNEIKRLLNLFHDNRDNTDIRNGLLKKINKESKILSELIKKDKLKDKRKRLHCNFDTRLWERMEGK